MLMKVLGSGCTNCDASERATRNALAELAIDAEIHHVTDYRTIVGYG